MSSTQSTGKMESRSLDSKPDETRRFDKGRMDIANIGQAAIGRFTFEPGWKWSTSVKPVVKTESCQMHHTGYIISGRMKARMDDGTEMEFGPGEAVVVPPGHDAWVVGTEPCVGVDFTGAKTYAQK
jgi:mannose-6-phosphate isomerase-like protein (cupin superfamily)